MAQSIQDKAIARIYGHGRDWAFPKTDFLDIGQDDPVRQALCRLAEKGTIRRVARGIYDYPKFSRMRGPGLGNAVSTCVSRRYGQRTPQMCPGSCLRRTLFPYPRT